jgi:KDO2-lipid IV(A) lauroyltransferase
MAASPRDDDDTLPGRPGDRLVDLGIRALLGLALRLPYDRRIPFMGRVVARLVAPVAGYRRRALANLAATCPEIAPAARRRIADGVADNLGRSIAEIWSGPAFAARIARADPLTGPGLEPLMSAAAAGRPVILAVAHFGNYDAMRAALVARGVTVGAVYRPMDNPWFNTRYTAAIRAIAEPLFARDRAGTAAMLRFLRQGGVLALGTDQHYRSGAPLRFFGRTAWTTLSPATLALRYDCDLIPVHAIRRPSGLDFTVRCDTPIPRSDPETMMQAVNDNLEALVREHMDQWLWIHRRWKGPAAAGPAPAAGPGGSAPPDGAP